MAKKKERAKIQVEVEFTEGYEQRFTAAILKIYSNRLRKAEVEAAYRSEPRRGVG